MNENLMTRFKKAKAEFWKEPDLDVTEALLELDYPSTWTRFALDQSGLTEYLGLYRDQEIGVYLFRSAEGAIIPPHYHNFPERVVFIRGAGSLVIDRDYDHPIRVNVDRSILIPAGRLHEGGQFKDDGGPTLSLCVFYYHLHEKSNEHSDL